MPAHSHYIEAYADDDEVAELLARDKREEVAIPPPLSQWNPLVAELATLNDRIATLIRLQASGDVQIPPRQRPVTEIDRARERRKWTDHQRLVGRLLPNRHNDD